MSKTLGSELQTNTSGMTSFKTEWVLSNQICPSTLTASAIVFATNSNNELALTHHPIRGWQVPGGHIEPGESAEEAVRRELREEAGMIAEHYAVLGFIRIQAIGDKPKNYSYPYPIRYCQVYRADAVEIEDLQPIADADDRGLFALDSIQRLHPGLGKELLFLPYVITTH